MLSPFWYELRVTGSGESINVGGGAPRGVHDGFDWGYRRLGDSWSDWQVVQMAVAHLSTARRVILLSADRHGDREGLKTILNREIRPLLNRDLSHGLSLVLLLQRPRTRTEGYVKGVEAYLRRAPFEPGFQQQIVPPQAFSRGPRTLGSGGTMDYTQQGVLAAQVRVYGRLRLFLVERGIVLDPGSPLWFDGRLDLPKPGEPWKMALSCRGATASVEFTPTELDAFLFGYPDEVVSDRLRQAVAALQKPKPQEHGLA
jgi:hypothetical protein